MNIIKRRIYIFSISLIAVCILLILSTKFIFENISSNILGTKVTVGQFYIQPFSGILSLKNLNIKNLKHLKEPSIFAAKEVNLNINLKSILSSVIQIEDIQIKSGKITYEFDPNISLMSNVERIKDNINNYSPGKSDKRLIIRNLLIHNCSFVYNLSEPSSHTISIPLVNMRDIGLDEHGIYPDQVGWKIILQIIKQKVFSIADYF